MWCQIVTCYLSNICIQLLGSFHIFKSQLTLELFHAEQALKDKAEPLKCYAISNIPPSAMCFIVDS